MNTHSRRGVSGLFLGLMFIGLGVGMIVGEPGAGILIGMGVGFLASTFIKSVDRKFVLSIPHSIGSVVIGFVGVSFIVVGLWMLEIIRLPEAYARELTGIFLVFLGLALITIGVRRHM